MFKLEINQDITLNQGDIGSILFTLEDYVISEGDKCVLIVYKDNRIILKKELTEMQHCEGYFSFNENDTKNIEIGTYNYDVVFRSERLGTQTIISNKKFKINRGFSNEL